MNCVPTDYSYAWRHCEVSGYMIDAPESHARPTRARVCGCGQHALVAAIAANSNRIIHGGEPRNGGRRSPTQAAPGTTVSRFRMDDESRRETGTSVEHPALGSATGSEPMTRTLEVAVE